MTAAGERVTPVLDIGGTHVTAALVDLEAGRVAPGTTSRRSLDGDGPGSSPPRPHRRLRE